jgi:hypothetical protein
MISPPVRYKVPSRLRLIIDRISACRSRSAWNDSLHAGNRGGPGGVHVTMPPGTAFSIRENSGAPEMCGIFSRRARYSEMPCVAA